MTKPDAHHAQPPETNFWLRQRSIETIDVALCIAYIVLALTLSYALSFGPSRFHNSNAVELVSGLGLSWHLISALFLANAMLLCSRWTRVFGWLLGSLLYGYYALSVGNSIIIHDNNGSAFAIAVAIAAVFSQISGLTRSMVTAEWRKPRAT